ncbi:MAG TPA: hypothetical protein PLW86_01070 [Rhodocyclaceae bacterium]|nr:hypothetical protein [Rhodocyclaceae bacterium]
MRKLRTSYFPAKLTIALLLVLPLSTPARAALSSKDLEVITLLALGPKNNEIRQCLDASSGLLEGLLAIAQAPDDKVVALLNSGEMTPQRRQMREQQAKLWREHHSPAKLAQFEFETCVVERGLSPITLGSAGEQCFNVTMVPAYASLLKTGLKASREEALEKIIKTWKAQTGEAFLRQVVDDIYGAGSPEQTQLIARKVFISCLNAGQAKGSQAAPPKREN